MGSTVAQTLRTFGKAPLVFLLFGCLGVLADIVQLAASHAGLRASANDDWIAQIVDLLVLCFTQTAMTFYVVRLSENRTASFGAAMKLGLTRYLPMVGVTLATLAAIGVGFFMLVIPGMLLALRFAVALPVCATERVGPIASMDRSATLTEGSRWPILGAYAIFYLPMIGIIVLMAELATTRDDQLFEWIFNALQIVWGPLIAILPAVVYVSLCRLKENNGVAEIFD